MSLILDVIGNDVALEKRGARYVGLCPFHDEKTPSFSVSAGKGLYYCFGCHAGGDAASYLMRRHGLTFLEAKWRLEQHESEQRHQQAATGLVGGSVSE